MVATGDMEAELEDSSQGLEPADKRVPNQVWPPMGIAICISFFSMD